MEHSGSSIRNIRRQLGFTQRQLAELIGVTFVTISRWESNRVKPNRLALRALSALIQQDVHNTRSCTIPQNQLGTFEFKNAKRSSTLLMPDPLTKDETANLPQESHKNLDVLSREDKITDILQKSKVFSVLSKQQRSEFSKIVAIRYLKAGQFLYHEGDILQYFYIVATGKVKIFVHSTSGNDFIHAFNGPGGVQGDITLLLGKPHPTSAQAITAVKVLAIKKADFLSFLSSYPDLGFKIFRRILIGFSIRLINLEKRIADMAVETAQYRVVYVLLRLSGDFSSMLPFTHAEIAQMAGTATETVSRIINRLKASGVIHTLRHKIIVLDQIKLQKLLEINPGNE